jgi:hypothetical protein
VDQLFQGSAPPTQRLGEQGVAPQREQIEEHVTNRHKAAAMPNPIGSQERVSPQQDVQVGQALPQHNEFAVHDRPSR